MTEQKHTPGPWRFAEGSATRGEMSSVYASNEFRIAYVMTEHLNMRQREIDLANAQLIAAAPELLEALRAIVELEGEAVDANRYGTATEEQRVFNMARSAIAKATEQKGKVGA